VKCGLCREACPIFRVIRSETLSPRGKAVISERKGPPEVGYRCTLCKACREACPLGLDLPMEEMRLRAAQEGRSPSSVREMMENVWRYGNPFGDLKEEKVPSKLYCC